jgi:hypothetical protein
MRTTRHSGGVFAVIRAADAPGATLTVDAGMSV